jgi:hypothetical protein
LAALLMVGSLIMVASATRQANVGVTTPQAG